MFGGGVERARERFPAVETGGDLGGSDDHVLAAEDEVLVAGARDVLLVQVFGVVVRGVAANTEVVEELAHVFGLRLGPVKIGRIKFHALVAHLGDGLHGSFEILLQGVANGIEFEADGNGVSRGAAQGHRKHGRHSEKGAARKTGNTGRIGHVRNATTKTI